MTAFLIVLCEDVEQERLHIIIEGLVIQKKLGQQTEVLAEQFADISINLNTEQKEHEDIVQNAGLSNPFYSLPSPHPRSAEPHTVIALLL